MWVMTPNEEIVNIARARRVVLQIEPDGYTATVIACFDDGECALLARVSQPGDQDYSISTARAYYRSIQQSLRNGEAFCNLCSHGQAT